MRDCRGASIVSYRITLYCIACRRRNSIVLHRIVWHCIASQCIALYCSVLYCIVRSVLLYGMYRRRVVAQCVILHCIALCCVVLYCMTLCRIVLSCIVCCAADCLVLWKGCGWDVNGTDRGLQKHLNDRLQDNPKALDVPQEAAGRILEGEAHEQPRIQQHQRW